ncbi:putative diacylglycerol kinase catalytic domain-containing protein [Rosellinia necatrix]|uniref:Putative diacylglycerol kinase catalytic domain-containing protein n=1 Tax=Rosellinia necatrix TaxID=77044 RepID=A0A1W2TPW0_ROSNE|nr:putative diacylglycerol kinase catalytic domain-containing protein [Rosellinia necatrix]
MATENPADQPKNNQAVPSPAEVICVLKKQASAGDIYEIISLNQGEQGGKPSFTLHRASYAESDNDGNKTLQRLFEDFGINGPPAHLQPGPQRRVHVIVSTLSGTGLSVQFYDSVLAPLLEAVGLTTAGESEPRDAEQQGSYHLLITQDAGSVKNFARGLADQAHGESNAKHTVVLLSGDGGVIDMLNGYTAATDSADIAPGHEADPQSLPLVAILPLGTGNALFSSLHKTVKSPAASDLVHGLRTLLRGKAAPLPSFKVVFPEGSRTITYSEVQEPAPTSSDSLETAGSTPSLEEQTGDVTHLYGVVVASYGFHSQLVWESDTPAYRRHGAARFQMVAQELLKESHAYRATVEMARPAAGGEAAGTERLGRDRHAYILATPVSNLEKTFCISPASRPLDGQLRLVHFEPVGGAKTMEIMMAAYDGGKHIDMRWGGPAEGGQGQGEGDGRVGYEDISELRITTHEQDARWRKVCIDGTIVEIPTDGCMVVRKETRRHLEVLVDETISY